ncbi:MAG: hypothetical protein HC915_02780 [Anaerolineae bacterium]|nr:hypothetical protein [Anaerolineae bacterium]
MSRALWLALYRWLYTNVARPGLFRQDAQAAHARALEWLGALDVAPALHPLLQTLHRTSFPQRPTLAGGVRLPHPAILAAGFVKGLGFADETSALAALAAGQNLIPGCAPCLCWWGQLNLAPLRRNPAWAIPVR